MWYFAVIVRLYSFTCLRFMISLNDTFLTTCSDVWLVFDFKVKALFVDYLFLSLESPQYYFKLIQYLFVIFHLYQLLISWIIQCKKIEDYKVADLKDVNLYALRTGKFKTYAVSSVSSWRNEIPWNSRAMTKMLDRCNYLIILVFLGLVCFFS